MARIEISRRTEQRGGPDPTPPLIRYPLLPLRSPLRQLFLPLHAVKGQERMQMLSTTPACACARYPYRPSPTSLVLRDALCTRATNSFRRHLQALVLGRRLDLSLEAIHVLPLRGEAVFGSLRLIKLRNVAYSSTSRPPAGPNRLRAHPRHAPRRIGRLQSTLSRDGSCRELAARVHIRTCTRARIVIPAPLA